MEITLNIDLEAAITGALRPEKLQPILDKHVTDAITSAISDATGYSSEFRKTLSKQLKEVLPHGLGTDDLVKFQHILNQALNSAVSGGNLTLVQTALSQAVLNTLPTMETTVKMSELLTMARDDFSREDGGAFYAYFEESEYDSGGHLYLDRNASPGRSGFGSSSNKSRAGSKYDADISISFNKEGEAYALKLDGKIVKPTTLPTVISRFDTMLMSLYVGRTRIDIDMDDDDVQDFAREKYDD
ncbi:hypothetical protein [Herbaspirillum sp. YR522]|uniref:hypothetical protein n=1 Tax=Herbaspirillum sp. YR522 TaxID=1144342 RepID=UPI00026FA293|nr:hypothetical protein [Herbaspirillum sp. YR522]EJN06453.1 hypothetical protein PMI40_02239 [Herbaspirillum sp. YR522]